MPKKIDEEKFKISIDKNLKNKFKTVKMSGRPINASVRTSDNQSSIVVRGNNRSPEPQK